MLNKKEEAFIEYWSKKRTVQKKDLKQFLKGLSWGLFIGISIILVLLLGWYKRANMEANSLSTPIILVVAILIISVFMGFIYQTYRWELNEQQYLELINKKKKNRNANS